MIPTHTLTSRTIVQRAIRALYPYGSQAVVRRGPLNGQRIVVSPSMGFSFIWNLDFNAWAWVWENVKLGSCVYDVGANFGQSTLRLANAVGRTGRVIAFEPMPRVFPVLCRNVAVNDLTQVTTINAAAAEREGVGQFTVISSQPDQGRLAAIEQASGPAFEVNFVTLDSYEDHGWPKPDLVKIDVEGGAPFVLAGATGLFQRVRPLLYIELHGVPEHEALADLCQRFGYIAYNMKAEVVQPRHAYYCGPLICRPE